MTDDNNEKMKDRILALWISQTDMFWRTFYHITFIAAAIFGGWYALIKSNETILSYGVLIIGVAIMVCHTLILRRMAQYLIVFAQKAGAEEILPHPGTALFGYPGHKLGQIIPMIMGILFLSLLVLQLTGIFVGV